MKSPFLLITFLLSFLCGEAVAQKQSFQSDPNTPFEITIVGSSTLHDWSVKCQVVQEYPTQLDVTVKEGNKINAFGFNVEVKSMEGGRGSIMNDKIFAALKSTEHPMIKFRQTTPATISKINSDGSFTLLSKGVLQMAGVEKEVSINVSGSYNDGVLSFSGSYPMKMTDFQIDPPSALFGQIQTKDDITVNYKFVYQLKK